MIRPWLLALSLLAGPAAAQAPPRFEDAGDVDAVARRLGLATGRTILVAPGVAADAPVSIEPATWREAADALAAQAACEVVEVDEHLVVLRPRASVSLSFAGADARTALQLVSAYAGRDLIVDADAPAALVTLELNEVPWDEALGAIAFAARLDVDRDGDLLRVRAGRGEVRVGAALPAWLRSAWSGARLLEGPTVKLEGSRAWPLLVAATTAGGASLLADPAVATAGVEAIDWEPLPWRAALTRLALRSGWLLTEERGVVVVRPQRAPSLQLSGSDASAVAGWLAAQGGDASVVVEPGLTGSVTIDLKALPTREAVTAVVSAAGGEVEDQGDLLVVRPRGAPGPRPRPRWRAPEDAGPGVDLDASDRPLTWVLDELGRRGGGRVDADWRTPRGGEPARVHARLRGVPWRAAVEVVTRLHGAEVQPAPGGLRVEPPPCVRVVAAGADLAVLTSALAARAGVEVTLDDGLRAAPFEVHVGSWRRALEALALSLGADLVDDGPGRVRVASRAPGPRPAVGPAWAGALGDFEDALRAESAPAIDLLFRPRADPLPAEPPSLRELLVRARQRLEAGAAEEAARLCDEAWARADGSPALEGLVAEMRERAHAQRRILAVDLRPAALLLDARAGTAEALVAGRLVRAGDELVVGDLPVTVLQVDAGGVRFSALGVTVRRERPR